MSAVIAIGIAANIKKIYVKFEGGGAPSRALVFPEAKEFP